MGDFVYEIREEGRNVCLLLAGDLTLGNSNKVKESMLEALHSGKPVFLDIRDVEDVDVSFFQLICSFHRSGLEYGFELKLKSSMPKKIRERAVTLGWRRTISCVVGRGHECIWVKEFKDE